MTIDQKQDETLTLYSPTVGCRIIKFNTKKDGLPVEVWDTSGDMKYERCWPAFVYGNDDSTSKYNTTNKISEQPSLKKNNVDAIILIYNPENPNHMSERQTWLEKIALIEKRSSSDFSSKSSGKTFRPHLMLLEHKNRSITFDTNGVKKTSESLPSILLERCIAIHTTEFFKLEDVLTKFENFVKEVAGANAL